MTHPTEIVHCAFIDSTVSYIAISAMHWSLACYQSQLKCSLICEENQPSHRNEKFLV